MVFPPIAPPTYLGEHNSINGGGASGISNRFGAALWYIDFNLLCASNDIRRVHIQGGCVACWNKPPYQGSIGKASQPDVAPKIANISLSVDTSAAYAAYNNDMLCRIMVVNMIDWNATDDNPHKSFGDHPIHHDGFELPQDVYKKYTLQRLLSDGSNALSGSTSDGHSYDLELDHGKPVLLSNVTRGETGDVADDGKITISVPRSSAMIVHLE